MTYFAVVMTIIGALFVQPTWAGPGSSGGGDAIRCDDGRVYALDYILTEGGQEIAPNLQTATSGEEILKAVADKLRMRIPALGNSLDDFRKFSSEPSSKSKRLWLTRSNPLLNLNDQNIDQIPVNCLDRNNNPNIWQAVIRTIGEGSFILYQRDQNALNELAKNSPVQVSFMYLHEWLRDYSDSAQTIRNVNRYLHSKGALDSSPEELKAVLLGFGLRISSIPAQNEIAETKRRIQAFNSKMTRLEDGCDSITDRSQRLDCLEQNLTETLHMVASADYSGSDLATLTRVRDSLTNKAHEAR